MNKADLQLTRRIVFDAYCEGDTEAEALLDVIDRALAAPEQEPFCYVNVNAQGDVTRTIKREDKWCKTPLYRHPAPQSAQPTDCTRIMREQGKPYPRTCPRCKLGPCAYSPTIAVTAPPSREWQGLTEDERATLLGMGEYMTLPMKRTFARAIEDSLRAKNSGEK